MLLVDDDESLRRALARALRLAGFDVEAFSSAESFLDRGVDDDDACLVLDIDLPGMDGLACKRKLAASGHDLPTIFITALPAAEVGGPLTTFTPVAVLYKPFNKDDLVDAVERACS